MVTRQQMREAAAAFGREGGKKRAKSMTPEQRRESAQKAAQARWAQLRALTKEIKTGTKKLERQAQKRLAELEERKTAK